jgi:hypothetical protein
MHLSAFDRSLWATGFIGEAVLLAVLFVRRRAQSFPIFTTLIAFAVARTFTLLLIFSYASPGAYYYSYWSFGAVDMLLQVGVVYEIASLVFAPLGRWAPDVRSSFIRLIGGSVLVALVLMALASPVKRTRMEAVVESGTFFLSVLMTELFVGLVALSAISGLPWKTHVARIAQGLGAFSMVGVLFDTSLTWFGWKRQADSIHALGEVRTVFYIAAVMYWIVTLWRKAESRQLTGSMRLQIFNLQRQVEYDLGRIRGWRKI